VETSKPVIVLFDGVCNLCNSSVQFIIKKDHKRKFKFASLQSELGRAQLVRFNLNPDSLYSFIVIDNNVANERSNAVLCIAKHLGAPWSTLTVFKFLPKFLRDAVYNFIASNRYSFFGKKDSCMIPTPDLKERFIG
jgi:predicted DCC family thiol-disulfide oxidoreductase YuxK